MKYKDFGKTGKNVSVLGFGAMRLPMIKDQVDQEQTNAMIQKAIDSGINYFDTGSFYCNGQSEKALGIAVKNLDRSKIYLSTKYPETDATAEELRQKFEKSLKEMNQEYIDFYHFWGIDWKRYTEKLQYAPLKEALKLKDEGLIKHLSFSFHSDNPDDLIKLVDTGQFETVLCQYNLLDRSNEKGIAYAAEKGMGVAIMGPVGGGRLAGPSKIFNNMLGNKKFVSTPELAMRFVFNNPNITMTLSGMSTMEQLLGNIKIANMDVYLNEADNQLLEQAMQENKKLADLYCTGCKYCLPCPQKVNIPLVFELFNYYNVYDIPEAAISGYRDLTEGREWLEGKNASFCIECGVCEGKCPQRINIIDNLKKAHALLSK